jgi:hypothetical protein
VAAVLEHSGRDIVCYQPHRRGDLLGARVGTADSQYGQLQAAVLSPDVLLDRLLDSPVELKGAVQSLLVAGKPSNVVDAGRAELASPR